MTATPVAPAGQAGEWKLPAVWPHAHPKAVGIVTVWSLFPLPWDLFGVILSTAFWVANPLNLESHLSITLKQFLFQEDDPWRLCWVQSLLPSPLLAVVG